MPLGWIGCGGSANALTIPSAVRSQPAIKVVFLATDPVRMKYATSRAPGSPLSNASTIWSAALVAGAWTATRGLMSDAPKNSSRASPPPFRRSAQSSTRMSPAVNVRPTVPQFGIPDAVMLYTLLPYATLSVEVPGATL